MNIDRHLDLDNGDIQRRDDMNKMNNITNMMRKLKQINNSNNPNNLKALKTEQIIGNTKRRFNQKKMNRSLKATNDYIRSIEKKPNERNSKLFRLHEQFRRYNKTINKNNKQAKKIANLVKYINPQGKEKNIINLTPLKIKEMIEILKYLSDDNGFGNSNLNHHDINELKTFITDARKLYIKSNNTELNDLIIKVEKLMLDKLFIIYNQLEEKNNELEDKYSAFKEYWKNYEEISKETMIKLEKKINDLSLKLSNTEEDNRKFKNFIASFIIRDPITENAITDPVFFMGKLFDRKTLNQYSKEDGGAGGLYSNITTDGYLRNNGRPYNKDIRRDPYSRKTGIPRLIENASNNENYDKADLDQMDKLKVYQLLMNTPQWKFILDSISNDN